MEHITNFKFTYINFVTVRLLQIYRIPVYIREPFYRGAMYYDIAYLNAVAEAEAELEYNLYSQKTPHTPYLSDG